MSYGTDEMQTNTYTDDKVNTDNVIETFEFLGRKNVDVHVMLFDCFKILCNQNVSIRGYL